MKHYRRFLIFKSTRGGLDRPWLVFSPSERDAPSEETWTRGYASWSEAIQAVLAMVKASGRQ